MRRSLIVFTFFFTQIFAYSLGSAFALGSRTYLTDEKVNNSAIAERTINMLVKPCKVNSNVGLSSLPPSPVTFASIPSNATVYLNNQKMGTTELGVFLEPGRYELRLEMEGYLPITEMIEVIPTNDKKKNVFNYQLIKNKGILQLSVAPSTARISINGKQVDGKTFELSPGRYSLEISADKYDSFKEEVEIVLGNVIRKEVVLKRLTGLLILEIQPAEAKVTINKESKSGSNIELFPGNYEIQVSAPGYYPESQMIQIERDKNYQKTFNLKRKKGSLQFTVKPLDAQVTLIQGGIEQFRWEGMNLLNEMETGTYELVVKLKNYKTFRKRIDIRENETTIENIQLQQGSDLHEMIFICGGEFTMGCTDRNFSCAEDETPAHEVILNSFLLSKTETTVEAFSKFIRETGYKTDAEKRGSSNVLGVDGNIDKRGVNWKYDARGMLRSEYDKQHPVIHVSWNDAVAYCNWLSEKDGLQKAYIINGNNIKCDFKANGYRLPTEAEWEFASQGGNQSQDFKFSGSNNLKEVAWSKYDKDVGLTTMEVGIKLPNELGLYDMSGNVYEWCWDWYGCYLPSKQIDPQGPEEGKFRILKGGSWGNEEKESMLFRRGGREPNQSTGFNGFRVAKGVEVSKRVIKLVTFPADAELILDGYRVQDRNSIFTGIGKHSLAVKKKGYMNQILDIEVTPDSEAFTILLNEIPAVDIASYEMVYVEGGSFRMGFGSEALGGKADEIPLHQVNLNGFLIGKYEVTQDLWEKVMRDNPSKFLNPKKPVNQISWEDAILFCNKISALEGLKKAYNLSGNNVTCDFTANGYRLPTEAEWEYAARGGNQSRKFIYGGSSDYDAVAWHYGNSGGQPSEVGLKQPNEIGLYDMNGNVWEWCWDWYGSYKFLDSTNPKGPAEGDSRILRGGSYATKSEDCRNTARGKDYKTGFSSSQHGLRLVRSNN